MAKMAIKCKIGKVRTFSWGDGNTALSLWVQDTDNSKLKLPITVFYGDDVDVGEGDIIKAICDVQKRQNKMSGEWEYSFVANPADIKVLRKNHIKQDDWDSELDVDQEVDIPF